MSRWTNLPLVSWNHTDGCWGSVRDGFISLWCNLVEMIPPADAKECLSSSEGFTFPTVVPEEAIYVTESHNMKEKLSVCCCDSLRWSNRHLPLHLSDLGELTSLACLLPNKNINGLQINKSAKMHYFPLSFDFISEENTFQMFAKASGQPVMSLLRLRIFSHCLVYGRCNQTNLLSLFVFYPWGAWHD